ncbi:MAG: hypothetical protein CBC10_002040 [Gammaproteobacteria bacterium TMED50]|nr:MAG: hypothetical protein CBC10_002040 [Gammaproteobacteria bacterium TMED50]
MPSNVDVPVHVVSGENNFTTVIQYVMTQGVSLLIKAADTRNLVTATLFGSTDLQLIRKCPCAVWILKPGAPVRIRHVLGAIDLTHDTDDSLAIAGEIIDPVQQVANTEGAQGHLITAWTAAHSTSDHQSGRPTGFPGLRGRLPGRNHTSIPADHSRR